ncbi:MAG: hypothetical protein JJU29_00235 [Verrucomicrobia bacterium]|nr:hypothetical protein [Verrucomicrobiota bacterium]MCH8511013.1 hypothetical protein [Kiritimatiellia bacterium]
MNKPDRLGQHSFLMMAATLAGHFGNYAYHFISGRWLTDGEYGMLVALLAVVNMTSLPLGALGLSITRAFAVLNQSGRHAQLHHLLCRWFRRLGLVAAALMLLSIVFAGSVGDWLGMPRRAPVLLAMLIIAMNLFLLLTGAALQGLQRFGWLAARSGLLFMPRAVFLVFCLLLGAKTAGWALLAHGLGMCMALGISLWALRRLHGPRDSAPSPYPPLMGSTLKAMPALLGFAVLMSADVVLAKRFFPADAAGHFARAAVLGRMILWLPLPVAAAMFPKVVGQAPHLLKKACAFTLALILVALAGCWLGADLLLWLLYGIQNPAPQHVAMVRHMGLAMAPLGLVHVVLHYELAQNRVRHLWPLILIAAGYLIGVRLYHPSLMSLIHILQIATSLALVQSLFTFLRETSSTTSLGCAPESLPGSDAPNGPD